MFPNLFRRASENQWYDYIARNHPKLPPPAVNEMTDAIMSAPEWERAETVDNMIKDHKGARSMLTPQCREVIAKV